VTDGRCFVHFLPPEVPPPPTDESMDLLFSISTNYQCHCFLYTRFFLLQMVLQKKYLKRNTKHTARGQSFCYNCIIWWIGNYGKSHEICLNLILYSFELSHLRSVSGGGRGGRVESVYLRCGWIPDILSRLKVSFAYFSSIVHEIITFLYLARPHNMLWRIQRRCHDYNISNGLARNY